MSTDLRRKAGRRNDRAYSAEVRVSLTPIEAHRTDLARLAAMTAGFTLVLVATLGITAPRMSASAYNGSASPGHPVSTLPMFTLTDGQQ